MYGYWASDVFLKSYRVDVRGRRNVVDNNLRCLSNVLNAKDDEK